jgi:site-specific recombinase XerD
MELNAVVEQFCDHARLLRCASPATVRRYRATLKRFQGWSRVRDIEECRPDLVRGFFQFGREERQWSVHTLITYEAALEVFFRWCVQVGHLHADPTAGLERPKPPRWIPARLTAQQAQRLLDTARSYPYRSRLQQLRNYALIATLLFTGLRKGELLRLQLPDVDLDDLTILVRQGKGSQDRVVPINGTLVSILREYLRERQVHWRTCPELFVSSNRNHPFTDQGLKRVIGDLVEATGFQFHAHTLRHSFATLMLEGGCDVFSLSRMMGHRDIKTTTLYLAASATHLRGQVDKHPLGRELEVKARPKLDKLLVSW